MSGDVQPRKRKDKKRRKDETELEPIKANIPVLTNNTPNDDQTIHVHKEGGTGGGICAKLVFFILFSALAVLIGLIITEHRGLTDVEVVERDSKFAQIFEGWTDSPSEHSEHDLHEAYEHDEDDDHDEHDDDHDENDLEDSEEGEHEDEDEHEVDDEEVDHDEDESNELTEEVSNEDEDNEDTQEDEDVEEAVDENVSEYQDEDEDEEDEDEGDNEDEQDEDDVSIERKNIVEDDEDHYDRIREDEQSEEDLQNDTYEDDDDDDDDEEKKEDDDKKEDEDDDDYYEKNESVQKRSVKDDQLSEENAEDDRQGDDDEQHDNDEVKASKGDASETEDKIDPDGEVQQSSGMAVKIGVGVALLVVAHLVLVRKWRTAPDVKSTRDETKEATPDLTRRNTIVMPPSFQEVEPDIEQDDEEYSEEEEEVSDEEIKNEPRTAKQRYTDLQTTYSRSFSPSGDDIRKSPVSVEDEEDDEEISEEEEDDEEVEDEELLDEEESENEDYDEEDENDELLKRLEARYGKLPGGQTKVPDSRTSKEDAYEHANVTNKDDFKIREVIDEAQKFTENSE